jgi:hypothetical protein
MSDTKKGGLKNYLILIGISLFTVVLAFYLFSWYRNANNVKLNTPVIASVLSEIKYEDIDNVLQERDFLIIYTCTSSELKCRNFEAKFSSYIKSHNLSDTIVYFNLGYDAKAAEEGGMLNTVYSKYKSNELIKKVYNYPTLFVFSNGKIIDLLSPNKDKEVTIKNVKEFLEDYVVE